MATRTWCWRASGGRCAFLRNERGRLTEATKELGLDGFVGWWNGVTAGDFDGDGRIDLVASNWVAIPNTNAAGRARFRAIMEISTRTPKL